MQMMETMHFLILLLLGIPPGCRSDSAGRGGLPNAIGKYQLTMVDSVQPLPAVRPLGITIEVLTDGQLTIGPDSLTLIVTSWSGFSGQRADGWVDTVTTAYVREPTRLLFGSDTLVVAALSSDSTMVSRLEWITDARMAWSVQRIHFFGGRHVFRFARSS